MDKRTIYHFPRLAEKIIDLLCKEELTEEIIGNLHEYLYNISTKGRKFRYLKFWYEVISYLRPSTLKRFSNSKSNSMNFFNPKLAIRTLWKHKAQSMLNLSGFALGIMCVTVLYFYVSHELSYDQFHNNKENAYRLIRQSQINGDSYDIGVTSGPFGPAMLTDYPGSVNSMVRFAPRERLVKYEDNVFREKHFAYADTNFFSFFSFPLTVGDAKTVLSTSNSVVISKNVAEKYFGKEDPLGKVISVDNKQSFQVTGIFDDFPGPSHLKFDMVAAISVYEKANFMQRWWWNSLYTYVELDPRQDLSELEATFPGFMDKYFGSDFERSGNRIDIKLESLADVYFNHNTRYDQVLHGNKNTVATLGLVAFAILLIACFNYLNLSLASTITRTKETGIRKVLGSDRKGIIFQFIGESLILLLGGIILAVLLTQLLLPVFNQWFDLAIDVQWLGFEIIMFYTLLVITILMLSSIYPALVMASYSPIQAFRDGKIKFGKGIWVRKGLVVLQFIISIFMIISTWMINIQLDYISNKDLGFESESIVLVDLHNSELMSNSMLLKDKLLQNSDVSSVTNMSGEPGGFHDATAINITGMTEQPRLRTLSCDADYLNTFQIKVKSGRAFKNDIPTDLTHTTLINESALREIGITIDEVFAKKVMIPFMDSTYRSIIGIVEDYHFSTLKDEIEPLVIIPYEDNRKMAIKINTENPRQGIQSVHEIWDEVYPNYPFTYKLHEDKLAQLYSNETKQRSVFTAFSIVSVFLACLGIFGLVAHSTARRRKELGIRKVLGANISQLLGLITQEFIVLISISFLISVPIAWYFSMIWLDAFVYKIDLVSIWPQFAISGVIALGVAVITIAIRAFRITISNPTESLRYE